MNTITRRRSLLVAALGFAMLEGNGALRADRPARN